MRNTKLLETLIRRRTNFLELYGSCQQPLGSCGDRACSNFCTSRSRANSLRSRGINNWLVGPDEVEGGADLPDHYLAHAVSPAPGASITKAQTSAEAMFAIWNRSMGMVKMPAVRGTTARSGPMKRPKKTPHAPHREKNCLSRTARPVWRDSGQTRRAACLNRYPIA